MFHIVAKEMIRYHCLQKRENVKHVLVTEGALHEAVAVRPPSE